MMGFAGLERDTVTGLNLAVYREENPGRGGGIVRIRWDLELGKITCTATLVNSSADVSDPEGLKDERAMGMTPSRK